MHRGDVYHFLFKVASRSHFAYVKNVIGNKFGFHRLLNFIHYYLRRVDELIIRTLVKPQNEKRNRYCAYYEKRKDADSDDRRLNLRSDIEAKQTPYTEARSGIYQSTPAFVNCKGEHDEKHK